jgi:hypothetical protein
MNNSNSFERMISNPDISAILDNSSKRNKIDIEVSEMIRYFLRNQFGIDNFKVKKDFS